MNKHKPIFLWGMPGVGKSSIGKKIAKQLEWNWIDLDEQIEKKYKQSIAELVASKGIAFFRQAEHECLLELIQYTQTIVSCGGGTPIYFDNANLMLNAGICVYLAAEPKFIYSRLKQSKQERFMLQHLHAEELNAQIEQLFAERKTIYELAPIHIKFPDAEIEQIILELKTYPKTP